MIFSLEALKAAYGDALLLHYGKPQAPDLVIIDGGPRGVYEAVLKPRLAGLMRNPRRLEDGQLRVRLVMVSHIDDDHVNGILAMANELADLPGPKPYRIRSLWHNSFDDLLGNAAEEMAASLEPRVRSVLTAGVLPAGAPAMAAHAAMVVASVGQGRDLRNAARKLGWDINREFRGKLIRQAPRRTRPVAIGGRGGLTFTVLGPQESKLKALQKKWDQEIRKKGLAQDAARAAEYADTSVFNLSSIIVLAEAPVAGGRRRMLLTGDARGDHILEGLEAAGLLEDGRCHVDLLKLPHHGSNRNLEPEFFRLVTADHYLVSSNGERFDNPDRETLEWLAEARRGTGTRPFTVHLTYPVEEFRHRKRATLRKEIEAFADAGRRSGAYSVVCREPGAPSVRVDLGDALSD